jgi:hypothetical protein
MPRLPRSIQASGSKATYSLQLFFFVDDGTVSFKLIRYITYEVKLY